MDALSTFEVVASILCANLPMIYPLFVETTHMLKSFGTTWSNYTSTKGTSSSSFSSSKNASQTADSRSESNELSKSLNIVVFFSYPFTKKKKKKKKTIIHSKERELSLIPSSNLYLDSVSIMTKTTTIMESTRAFDCESPSTQYIASATAQSQNDYDYLP